MAQKTNFNFRVEIKGINELNTQLDRMIANIDNGLSDGINRAVNNTRDLAIILVKANSGELRNSIEREVNSQKNKVVGKVFVSVAKVPYVMYVYYGTGKYATMQGTGKSEWKVPASKVASGKEKKYGWTTHTGSSGLEDYYVISGQEANPFLEMAFDSSMTMNVDAIAEEVRLSIERSL